MADVFGWQLVLAFIVGSIWVTLTTVAAERFGTQVGGLVGGLPSTAVVSFFFIGLSQTPSVAAQSTTVFPLAYAFTGLFLVLYAALAVKGFAVALLGALLGWFALSALAVVADVESFAVSLVVYGLVFAVAYYVLEKKLKVASAPKGEIRHSTRQIAWRAAFSGAVIAGVVLVSKVAGPLLGGIFSAFPAVFISTLIIAYRARGIEFSRAITKPLMITGMVTIVVYSAGVRYFYPGFGLVIGTLLAYAAALISALFTAVYIRKRLG